MKFNYILIMLLGFFYSISTQGQSYKFETKVSDSQKVESIKTADYLPLCSYTNSSIKIELARASIKFTIYTEDSDLISLAKILTLNKEENGLPIQIEFTNGKVIKSKLHGMSYVKILSCETSELMEAYGLSQNCEYEININSLYTDVSGEDVLSKNNSFFALLNNNDIKCITICNNFLFSFLFDKVKSSEIVKQMSECFNKKPILSSKEDNIKRVVNFVRFLIDKPWGCLDDKDIKKSQFKQSIKEKKYFKTLYLHEDDNNELVYADGLGYQPVRGYYLLSPQELRVNDIHISPSVKFAGEKLIVYDYSIYLSERYNMNDANMLMSSIAKNLGFKRTGKFKTYSVGYILRGSCLYGKYKDSKIFISEPDKLSDYFINIYIIKDKSLSLIQ